MSDFLHAELKCVECGHEYSITCAHLSTFNRAVPGECKTCGGEMEEVGG